MNLERIELLGFGEDASEDAGEVAGSGEEEEAADGPGGDLDAPSWGQIAGASWHGCVLPRGGAAGSGKAP